MRLILAAASLLLFVMTHAATAAQKSVTLFLDGSRVEQELAAVRGYLEVPLPDSFTPGSLRVKPVGRGSVVRVELVSAESDRRHVKEIARLEQRKRELLERMQALSDREELFAAAAKSQSSRSPKKSKSNPDPLLSLRQGTDFALGRLESVTRGKRNCQQDLDAVERKLASAKKGTPLARIWITGSRASVSYLSGRERWTPCYDFRWGEDGGGELQLHARLPRAEKRVQYLVSNGTVAQGAAAKPVRGEFPLLSRYPLVLQGPLRPQDRPLSFAFNRVDAVLPPGEAAAYWRGEYLGRGNFKGADATELSIAAQ
jgi:hypothetical protein